MLTEKDYCDYETCVALKELGYVGSSRYYYTQRDHKFHYDAYNKFYTVRTADAMGYVLAVHLYDAQKFLREEKNIDVLIELETKDIHLSSKYYSIYISYMSRFRREFSYISKNFDSYEEALSEGIKEAIKILKEWLG
jgi:hypothetical protein